MASLPTLAVILFASMFVLGVAPNLRAQGCTPGSVQGTYGFVSSGTTVGLGPVGEVAIFTADGAGVISGRFTRSENGVIIRDTFTGNLYGEFGLHRVCYDRGRGYS